MACLFDIFKLLLQDITSIHHPSTLQSGIHGNLEQFIPISFSFGLGRLLLQCITSSNIAIFKHQGGHWGGHGRRRK